MTFLDWGCEHLEEECRSCLDALCRACQEDLKKRSGRSAAIEGLEEVCRDDTEPDCDRCDLEKKPDCAACEVIHAVCRNCADNPACEFRITGQEGNGIPDTLPRDPGKTTG